MSQNILVHDTRLKGSTPSGNKQVSVIYRTSGDTSLSSLLTSLAMQGSKEKIGTLSIMAHGASIEGDPNEDVMGAQLCKEGLGANSVGLTRVLSGKVDKIILYVCEAAVVNAIYDGRAFCKNLASYTGADVIASDTAQKYYIGEGGLLESLVGYGSVCFGDWEGGLWEFHPDQTITRLQ